MIIVDDDWLLKKRESEAKANNSSSRRLNGEKLITEIIPKRVEKPPSYLYPLQKQAYIIPTAVKSLKRGDSYAESDTEPSASPPQKEEEIKPKLVRPRNLDAHFKQILSEKQFDTSDEKDIDEDQQFSNEERFFKNDSVKYNAERSLEKHKNIKPSAIKQIHRTKSAPIAKNDEQHEDHRYRYHENPSKNGHKSSEGKYRGEHFDEEVDERLDYTENLTDKQKYRQSLMKKQQHTRSDQYYDDGFCAKEPMPPPPPPMKSSSRHEPPIKAKGKPYYAEERTIDSKKYSRHKSSGYDDVEFERNPYKEPDSLPYRESVECMIKSPVMRYKSYDDSEYRDECDEECMSDEREQFPAPHQYGGKYRGAYEPNERSSARQRFVKEEPMKENYHHSKEKMKHIERGDRSERNERIERGERTDRGYAMEKPPSGNHLRRMGAIPRQQEQFESNKMHRQHLPPRQNSMLDWSSDDEHFGQSSSPPLPSNVRIIPREHYEKNGRMIPSKSLGNLAKGYRHSYAEREPPVPPLPARPLRNSGRVGLAAVNPY